MKLPSHLRKLRKFAVYSITFYVLILVMFSPVPQTYAASSSLGNSPWFSNDSDLSDSRFETEFIVIDPATKKDIRPEEVGFPYTPQTQFSDSGTSFSVEDNMAVDCIFELNLTENGGEINNSYTLDTISDYSSTNLEYNITDVTAIQDYYPVESTATAGQFENLHYFNYIAWAQEFKVEWDYAKFYGAKILVNYINQLNPGTYELELVLVSANTSTPFAPNATDVISTELNGPYDSINLLPGGTTSNIRYYDFTDVVLEKGSYYIIANLSIIDYTDLGTKDYFVWSKNIVAPFEGKTFSMDDTTKTWSEEFNRDLTLIPELLASDVSGLPLTFNDPETIDLKDNGASITSLTQSIVGDGLHTLTSNTSVQINFENHYEFVKGYVASSIFSAANATYWNYSIDWNLTWSTPFLNLGNYTNLDRYQVLLAPSDWHNTAFTFYNETNTLIGSRETVGYRVDLGSNNSAGNWLLESKSPNYLSDLVLLDDTTPTERFLLGYWIGGVTDSTGYVGSKIVANTLVQGDGGGTPYYETTGSLNYTLYDINGNIIPMKSLVAPLIYTDTTSYTLSGITQVSAGFYTPEIYFDPSESGSDLPGFWTAAVMWQNGTEVGFYSQRIVVQTQTELVLEWKEEPLSNNWITTDISRKGLDSILVRGSYYNISESYTIGTKNVIPSATVLYTVWNATWNKNDVFNDYAPDYNTSIQIDADVAVGTYTVDFLATGAFLENNSTSFTLTVFYELALIAEYTNYQTNYTNNALYYLNLYDMTASANLSFAPVDMSVNVSNGLNYILSSPVDYTFTYQASSEQWILNVSTSTNNLDTGLYYVSISIKLNDYRANYSHEYVSDVYNLEITAPKTSIQTVDVVTSIYIEHSATLSFRLIDSNHSVALTGALVSPTSNHSVLDVDFTLNTVGDLYYVTINNLDVPTGGINVSITVTLVNYENVTSFPLGELEVLTIQTALVDVASSSVSYVGYETFVVVRFDDITHGELVLNGTLVSLIYSSSLVDNIVMLEIGLGEYNISFINHDTTVEGLNITVILGKAGYEDGSILFEITVISKATDSDLDDPSDQDITIYFGEGITIEILYWDATTLEDITTPTIEIDGDFSFTPSYNWVDNTTIIIFNPIYEVGTYYLNITILEPGFNPQMIQIIVTISERPTYLEIIDDQTNYTDYASEDIEVSFEYLDGLGGLNISIDLATITAGFTLDNSTLEINEYFDSITNYTFSGAYTITFNPDASIAVGSVYILVITFSRYGYETQIVIIRLIFKPPVSYDIDIDIVGEIRQLETIEFIVSLENLTQQVMVEGTNVFIHIAPTPLGDFVNITYTFTYANGTEVTYWELVELTPNDLEGGYLATLEVYIPWHVTNISYSVTYTPGGIDQFVIVAKSTTENQTVVANPTFVALLTYFFREYTLYMIIGIVAIAVIIIAIIIIQFTIVRPRKQRKKEGKRKYLDKISKILTSVLSLRKVIVVHTESGLPIYEWDLGGEITVDSSLVTGFLQAVAGMGSEISGGQTGAIKKLDYGQFVVSSASKDCICTYLFSTSEVSVDVETGLANFVEWFEKRFKSVLHDWSGITDEFTKNSKQIIDTLSEELFIWTLHPLSINTLKEKDVQKLNSFGQKIFNFIKDYKEVTISVALEYFNKTPLEETLSTLFNMIDEKYLLRMRLR